MKHHEKMNVAEIEELKDYAGSQGELAEHLGVNQSTICRAMKSGGFKSPSLDKLGNILLHKWRRFPTQRPSYVTGTQKEHRILKVMGEQSDDTV